MKPNQTWLSKDINKMSAHGSYNELHTGVDPRSISHLASLSWAMFSVGCQDTYSNPKDVNIGSWWLLVALVSVFVENLQQIRVLLSPGWDIHVGLETTRKFPLLLLFWFMNLPITLQGWFCYYITQEDWYAIKNKETKAIHWKKYLNQNKTKMSNETLKFLQNSSLAIQELILASFPFVKALLKHFLI